MKNRTIIFALALLMPYLCSWAEDRITVRPFVAIGSTDGGKFSMELTNEEEFTAMEFVLYLPKGMSLDAEHPLDVNPERFPGSYVNKVFVPSHTQNITNPSDGMYYVKLYNTKLEHVSGKDGELLTFHYSTSDEIETCTDSIKVTRMVLAIDSHKGSYPATYVTEVEMMSKEDYEDGIGQVNAPASAILNGKGDAYDLSGRMVGREAKGIIIRNEKKILNYGVK